MAFPEPVLDRRAFVGQTAAAAATVAAWSATARGADDAPRRVRVAVIGCGSVSRAYLPHLAQSPFVELVSACDRIADRAQTAAEKHNIPHHYPHVDALLAGAAFDLLVNLTDMQEHEALNRQALQAGRNVWSEKPLANSLGGGQELLKLARERGVRLWGAPTTVQSPQFAFMAKLLASGKLGRLAAAHADYGHTGPDWSSFFYERGGGSLPDLGVYNLTTLTGLLGPAQSVVAMTSIVAPTRKIQGKGEIAVTAEDNAMLLLDHGQGVISHVQSGFNYFNPHGHDGSQETRRTVTIVGSTGQMALVGYDWDPRGVDWATREQPAYQREATDKQDYVWQHGASLAAECLATGRELLVTPEQSLHIVEIMAAARASQETGRRIKLESTFKWPLVA